jgi:hypothetical protein
MKLPQVEFTYPAEWNPDIHDDNRPPDEMIRPFPVVPHDPVNKCYDLKGNVNLDYLRSAKTADIATEVANDEDSVDSGITGLQTRHSEDTSSDDDSDYNKNRPRHQQQSNGKFQLTTLLGRSLLVNVYTHNAQNEMQNVCIIVEKGFS